MADSGFPVWILTAVFPCLAFLSPSSGSADMADDRLRRALGLPNNLQSGTKPPRDRDDGKGAVDKERPETPKREESRDRDDIWDGEESSGDPTDDSSAPGETLPLAELSENEKEAVETCLKRIRSACEERAALERKKGSLDDLVTEKRVRVEELDQWLCMAPVGTTLEQGHRWVRERDALRDHEIPKLQGELKQLKEKVTSRSERIRDACQRVRQAGPATIPLIDEFLKKPGMDPDAVETFKQLKKGPPDEGTPGRRKGAGARQQGERDRSGHRTPGKGDGKRH